jgi:type II secretory pathway pseudopilin PulG
MVRQQGFAYLWLLLLVALMGVGMTQVATVYETTLRQEQEKELLFVGRQFREALRQYYEHTPAGQPQKYPASLEELLGDPRFVSAHRYLRRIYRDPVTGSAEWGLVVVAGRIVGVHSLSDQKPLKLKGFAAEDGAFQDAAHYSDWAFTYPPGLLIKSEGQAAPEFDSSGMVK